MTFYKLLETCYLLDCGDCSIEMCEIVLRKSYVNGRTYDVTTRDLTANIIHMKVIGMVVRQSEIEIRRSNLGIDGSRVEISHQENQVYIELLVRRFVMLGGKWILT